MAPTTTLEEFTRPKPSTIYHTTTTGQEHATTKKITFSTPISTKYPTTKAPETTTTVEITHTSNYNYSTSNNY